MPFLRDILRADLLRARRKLGDLAHIRNVLDRQLNKAMIERIRLTRKISQLERARDRPNINSDDLDNELLRQRDVFKRLTEHEIPWLVRIKEEAQTECSMYEARINEINDLMDHMVPDTGSSSSSSNN